MEKSQLEESMVRSEKIFNGVILDLYHDEIRLPDGNRAMRELVRHIGAVCVVPITDDGRVIVERQYRYPVGKVLLEIPAGKLNYKGENPEEAARRELREETGYTAGQLLDLGLFYPAAAYSDEAIHMYLARQLTAGPQELDADEFLQVEAIPLELLVRQILVGQVPDLKTQAAVLRAYCMQQLGQSAPPKAGH